MAVKRYDGTAWQTVAGVGAQGPAGANGADGTAPLTTKGDLLTYSTSATRLGVGTNGQVLTASSTAATGLTWQTPGALTLVSATTFSNVATHSVNNCFSSTYRYYRVLCDFTESVTTNRYLFMRLRASGTDSTANYNSVDLVGYNAVAAGETDPFGTDEVLLTALGTSLTAGGLDIRFLAPQIAAPTVYFWNAAGYFSSSYFYYTGAGTHSASTSYDGFTIYTSADNISGTVKVYGYQD